MVQATAEKPRKGNSIDPQTLYTLKEFQAASGMGDWAMRQARRAGLKVLKIGVRKYIKGQTFIDFLESVNEDTTKQNSPDAD